MPPVLRKQTFSLSAPDSLPSQPGVKRYFFMPKFCFAAIGIDPTSEERIIFNQFLAVAPMLTLLTLCFPMTLFALDHFDDMNKMTDALSPVWQSILAIMNWFIFMWNKEKIPKLVRQLWRRNLKALGEEMQIIIEENDHEAMLSITYYSVVFVTGIIALAAPFVIALFYSLNGLDFWENLEPPLKGVYLMDPKASYLRYAFAFLWDVFGIYYVIHGTLSTDTLFSWFIHNISAQFRILNLHLKSIAELPGADDNVFRKDLAQCVQYHRGIIDLVDLFNEVYKVNVFVKFLIICLQIAFLGFQFVRGGELTAQIFHFSFLISVSIQLMLYCYGGQKLKDVSSSVAFTIYQHFQWHTMSAKSKKLLMLPLMRAQKPCHLTGVFFVADLSLFLWVYKTAGSFITMMMTVQDKEV